MVFGRTAKQRQIETENGLNAILFMVLLILALAMYDETTRSLISEHMFLFLMIGLVFAMFFVLARKSMFHVGLASLGLASVLFITGFFLPFLELFVPVFAILGIVGMSYGAISFMSDIRSDLVYLISGGIN
jgi:hypothetical protein